VNKTQANENKLFWDKFLEVGRRRRTDDEWKRAFKLADWWGTCACFVILRTVCGTFPIPQSTMHNTRARPVVDQKLGQHLLA